MCVCGGGGGGGGVGGGSTHHRIVYLTPYCLGLCTIFGGGALVLGKLPAPGRPTNLD